TPTPGNLCPPKTLNRPIQIHHTMKLPPPHIRGSLSQKHHQLRTKRNLHTINVPHMGRPLSNAVSEIMPGSPPILIERIQRLSEKRQILRQGLHISQPAITKHARNTNGQDQSPYGYSQTSFATPTRNPATRQHGPSHTRKPPKQHR